MPIGHVRSPLTCFKMCSQSSACEGVSVCLIEQTATMARLERKVNCTLLSGVDSDGCDGMVAAESSSCYSARKKQSKVETTTEAEVQTTTELVCQNGGHVNGSECWCTKQYGGRTCERLIRDCTEPYDRGFLSPDHDGVYDIQPVASPHPFKVVCGMKYGGITFLIKKNSLSLPLNWSAFKAGFGDNLNVVPDSENYFIGMDNLYFVTSQAPNNVHFLFHGVGTFVSAFYDNFAVGDEASSYDLSYSRFFTIPKGNDYRTETAVDGFENATAPIKFATGDRNQGCAIDGPGWYGVNCLGSSPFAGIWPTESGEIRFTGVEIALVRTWEFYQN
ncbi:hypothetical protein V1264_006737 [Littorina saxatilis]|uniref:Fibrinogen C-terminal domain-containing protein n=2 Tax=Littorina saxatilis TaxID=31220 RepID=A0AAN9G4U4_9CAEN